MAILSLGGLASGAPDLASGGQVYQKSCATCHGAEGQGSVGPALAGAADRFLEQGIGKLMALKELPTLVREGIPGKMTGNPELTDEEITSLGDFLWDLGSWAASAKVKQVTALDLNVGAPPAGGWKWVLGRRTTGAEVDIEVSNNPNEHGFEWVFHVVKGSKEMTIPGGSVVLGEGEAELLPARGIHTHLFAAQSEVLGFRVHPASARPPDAYHRGEPLLFSEEALDLTDGVSYRLRVREITVAPAQTTPGIEAGPSFAYVVEGTLSTRVGNRVSSTEAGGVLELTSGGAIVASNEGTTPLRFVLVDLHQ
ncbi:MAG: c-type cytochrome [Chloroflexi bacterium]|nr:c-type cytochrome [Chloroflexota bacterium]